MSAMPPGAPASRAETYALAVATRVRLPGFASATGFTAAADGGPLSGQPTARPRGQGVSSHDSVGRYKGVRRATAPGDLPAEGQVSKRARQSAIIQHGAIADPNPALRGKRQRVAINIKTDPLEREYSAGRMSDAAYAAGRTYGRVLERSRRPISAAGGWTPGDHVDHADSHEEAIASRIDQAKKAVAMIADTAPAVGLIGQRVLELALVDALTLTAIATRMRGPGKQHVNYVTGVFRDSCEALADHWARRGNRAPR